MQVNYKSFLKSNSLEKNFPLEGKTLLDTDAVYFTNMKEIKEDIDRDTREGIRFRTREDKRRKLDKAISSGAHTHVHAA